MLAGLEAAAQRGGRGQGGQQLPHKPLPLQEVCVRLERRLALVGRLGNREEGRISTGRVQTSTEFILTFRS